MDWNQIEGNWKQFKGKVKEKWSDLTDDEIGQMDGSREQFEGRLQEKYGENKEAIKKSVSDWLNSL